MTDTLILTNAILKGLMTDAMVFRGTVTNLDNCKTPGIYVMNANTVSASPAYPQWEYGIVEVIKRGTDSVSDVFQRITHRYATSMAIRSCINNTWGPWYQLTLTPIT